ncbi:hypothetical protein HanRHA438_Chr11g0514811 [Helianthus annuus]|nr:hypothetical protein HanRHA438_Chr11g0514811 [Helianthus annuus]
MPTYSSRLHPKMPMTIMSRFFWVNNLIVNIIKTDILSIFTKKMSLELFL